MSEPQQIKNESADKANGVVQGLVNFIMGLAKKFAAGQAPWLAVPPISWIFGWASDWANRQAARPLKQYATKKVIHAQVDKQVVTSNNKLEALRLAILSGDEDAINKASDEFDEATRAVGHYDGDATDAH